MRCARFTARFVDRLALLEETGTAALSQPVEQVKVATWTIVVPNRHAVDQGAGEPLDPPQSAGLMQSSLLLSLWLLLVDVRTPDTLGCLEEVFGQPVGQKSPRLIGAGEGLECMSFLFFFPFGEFGENQSVCNPPGLLFGNFSISPGYPGCLARKRIADDRLASDVVFLRPS